MFAKRVPVVLRSTPRRQFAPHACLAYGARPLTIKSCAASTTSSMGRLSRQIA
jgi:hypothetical protein